MSNFFHSTLLLAAEGLGLGSGRAWANLAALLGLLSLVIGGTALARSLRGGSIVALAVGLAGLILSSLHLAYSAGGVGTGNGRLGAMIALALSLIGMILSGTALARRRRAEPS